MNVEDAISSEHSSDKRREDIERQWTQLLRDWVKVCGHAHTTLDMADLMDVVRMYGEDLFVECQPLPDALDRFIEERFPKLDIKLSDAADSSRDLYLIATVLLYHCITNGPVNAVISICLYLSLEQQTLVQKFCEQLKDVEVTVSTVDAAIAGAFESSSGMLIEEHEELHNATGPLDSIDSSNLRSFSLKKNGNSAQNISKPVNESDTQLTTLIASDPAETIDTLYLKTPFTVKSSAFGYPDRIISETKDITNSILSATLGSKNIITNTAGLTSTKVHDTKEVKKEESKIQVIPEFLNELDLEPMKLQASDFNVTRKKYTVNEAKKEDSKIHITRESLNSPDPKAKALVTNAPIESINTLFLKSSFTVKSSAFGYPENSTYSRSETKIATDTTESKNTTQLRSDATSCKGFSIKEVKKEVKKDCSEIQRTRTPESLKKLDKPELSGGIVTPNKVQSTKEEGDKEKNAGNKVRSIPVSFEKPELEPKTPVTTIETIDTLFLKSHFTRQTSSETKNVTNTLLTIAESRNVVQSDLNETSTKVHIVEKVENKNEKKNKNTSDFLNKQDLKLKKLASLNETPRKRDSEKFDPKSETPVTNDPIETFDTLYLKNSFSVKSSVFGYPGRASSETKKNTKKAMLATGKSRNDVQSNLNKDSIKVHTVKKVEKKHEKNIKGTSEFLMKQHLKLKKPKATNLNEAARKRDTDKFDSKSETPATNDPIETIDTLYLKTPFTVQSSTFGYPGKASTETNIFTITVFSATGESINVVQSDLNETNIKMEKKMEKKIQDTSEYFKKRDLKLKKSEASNLNEISRKGESERSYPKSETPVTNDPIESIDTLYSKTQFNVKSSAFGYPGKSSTEPNIVTKTIFSETDESRKIVKSAFETKKKTVAKEEEMQYKSTTKPDSVTPSKILTAEEKGIEIIKESKKFEGSPDHLKIPDQKSKKLVMSTTVGHIDTLFLKFPFTAKSSAFGYLSRIRAKTKNVTEGATSSTNESENILKTSLDITSNLKECIAEKKRNNVKEEDSEIQGPAEPLNKFDLEPKKPTSSTLIVEVADTKNSISPFTFQPLAIKHPRRTTSKKKNVTVQDPKVLVKKRHNVTNATSKVLHQPNITKDTVAQMEKKEEKINAPTEKKNEKFNRETKKKEEKINAGMEKKEETNNADTEKKEEKINAETEKKEEKINPDTENKGDKMNTETEKIEEKIKEETEQMTNCPCPICTCEADAANIEGSCSCLKSKRNAIKTSKKQRNFQGFYSDLFTNGANKAVWRVIILALTFLITLLILMACVIYFISRRASSDKALDLKVTARRSNLLDKEEKNSILINMNMNPKNNWFSWECKNGLCQRVYKPAATGPYKSLSRCTLLCTGPQLWPHPIGQKFFGNKIVALAKNKLQYSYKYVPSQAVHEYLNEAFNLFQRDLAKLEVTESKEKQPLDLALKDPHIEIDVESDPDPRLRLDTEESYTLTIETVDVVKIKIKSPSFCGVRHGLETLSQLILLDQSTGYLITLIHARIKDAPSYKYRGLMIDTARNYIPLTDLTRTIDAMAMCKLNTFHWRISDAASFPMVIPDYPQLFEYGAYDREMVYTVEDIKFLVERAGFRGIRVLIEVAAPGPVGRAWSWTTDAYTPPTKGKTSSASDVLCLRLKMHEKAFDVLEAIYTFIIKLTKVDDVFHLSNGLFSFVKCFGLIDDRETFWDKALARLRIANNGTIPRLPLIWYDAKLMSRSGWTWHNYGIQLHEEDLPERVLSKYKLIQSSRWDLSCEMNKHRCIRYRTWQQMYNWKTWRELDVMTIEGGEAVLWTDLVDKNNLDSHLWPRAAAVAERLWSDAMANQSASTYEYLRMDAQRWRMLVRGVKAQTVWPVWCSFNPRQCFAKIKT